MATLRLLAALAAFAAVAPACKKRPDDGSRTLMSKEFADLFKFDQVPPERLAELCDQSAFYLFVGDAETLGKVYIPDGLKPHFAPLVKAWEKEEWDRESKFAVTVRDQLAKLTIALAQPDPACTKIPVREKIKQRQAHGVTILVGLTDGPNIADKTGRPLPNGDAVIESWAFRNVPEVIGGIEREIQGPMYWRLKGDALEPLSDAAPRWTPVAFAGQREQWAKVPDKALHEVLIPSAVDLLAKEAKTIAAKHAAPDFAPDQSFYLFKAHGAPLNLGTWDSSPNLDGSSAGDTRYDAAFLFDSAKPDKDGKVSYIEEHPDYFSALWHPQAICQLKGLQTLGYQQRRVDKEAPAYKKCVEEVTKMAQERAPEGGQAARLGSGNPAGELGSGNPAGELGSGNPAGELGSGNPAGELGSGDPSRELGAGSPDGTQNAGGNSGSTLSGLSMAFGASLWGGNTQGGGGKGFVFDPEAKWKKAYIPQSLAIDAEDAGEPAPPMGWGEMKKFPYFKADGFTKKGIEKDDKRTSVDLDLTADRLFGMAHAFRFLGDGKSVRDARYGAVELRDRDTSYLRLLGGARRASFVLFDTCFANPGLHSELVLRLSPPAGATATPGAGKLVTLANPLPVLIAAFDYQWLSALKYSYLADEFATNPNGQPARDLMGGLAGDLHPPKPDEPAEKRRFLASLYQCDPKTSACKRELSNTKFAAWDKVYIGAKNVIKLIDEDAATVGQRAALPLGDAWNPFSNTLRTQFGRDGIRSYTEEEVGTVMPILDSTFHAFVSPAWASMYERGRSKRAFATMRRWLVETTELLEGGYPTDPHESDLYSKGLVGVAAQLMMIDDGNRGDVHRSPNWVTEEQDIKRYEWLAGEIRRLAAAPATEERIHARHVAAAAVLLSAEEIASIRRKSQARDRSVLDDLDTYFKTRIER